MVRCGSNITLGKINFDFLTELTVKTAWRTMTDTAVITLPRAVINRYNLQHKRYVDIVKRGDAVSLAWGYDNNFLQGFAGFVTGNKPGMPMTIEMEDQMFQYKEQSVAPKSWSGTVQVSDVLTYLGITSFNLIGEIGIIGGFSITLKESTVSKVLVKLKDSIGFPIFFRDGVLNVGDPYQVQNPTIVNLQIGYNVIDWKLEFKDAADISLKVIAISNLANGKKLKVILGDPHGEVHTLNFGPLDVNTLILRAKALFSRLKYSGFRGTVTLFGEPYIQHGDIANFLDPENEITGQYWVDAVERKTGLGGIRQVVTIGVTADGQQKDLMQQYEQNIQALGKSIIAPSKNIVTPPDADF